MKKEDWFSLQDNGRQCYSFAIKFKIFNIPFLRDCPIHFCTKWKVYNIPIYLENKKNTKFFLKFLSKFEKRYKQLKFWEHISKRCTFPMWFGHNGQKLLKKKTIVFYLFGPYWGIKMFFQERKKIIRIQKNNKNSKKKICCQNVHIFTSFLGGANFY